VTAADIYHIRGLFEQGLFKVSMHAVFEMDEEDYSPDDLSTGIANGRVLEDYPDHERGACCLIAGETLNLRPMHIVCSTTTRPIIVITVYEPKPPKWTTPTQRGRIP
jgi:Domain of unknown function (DUF4258)